MYARHKVQEARYYYCLWSQRTPEDEDFAYLFSAMVSALRSVTFAMQKMYAHNDGFDDDYESLRDQLRLHAVARQLVDARNTTQHEGKKLPWITLTIENPDTGDKFIYDFDPVPQLSIDIAQNVCYYPGPQRRKCNLPEDSKASDLVDVVVQKMSQALSELKECKNVASRMQFRLCPEGQPMDLQEIRNEVDSILRLLEDAAALYEQRYKTEGLLTSLIDDPKTDDCK